MPSRVAWRRRGLFVLPALAWLGLLAWLPWWLGLALWLLLAGGVALATHAWRYDRIALGALAWGLPGWLFAVQRALGGDPVAWVAALLGALAGFSLLAWWRAWRDRPPAVVTSKPAQGTEWPELALAPIGPERTLIELAPPDWLADAARIDDPRGGVVDCGDDGYRFPDGQRIAAAAACCFSPDGRWFAAATREGVVASLWDRELDRVYRPRGWILAGWHAGEPWLSRHAQAMPRSWQELAGWQRRWR